MIDRSRRVPSGRLARLAAFGQIAGGVATGVLAEGMVRIARGERPLLPELLLTPANARKVTEQLSRLRGAAMKLGQMLSLDTGDVLPAELTAILSQLRESAHIMPPPQLDRVLAQAWGTNWRRCFARFEARPIAAASIGQVHRAILPCGQELAVKVQYPGVAASIDADIDNVATLLRLSGLLPQASTSPPCSPRPSDSCARKPITGARPSRCAAMARFWRPDEPTPKRRNKRRSSMSPPQRLQRRWPLP